MRNNFFPDQGTINSTLFTISSQPNQYADSLSTTSQQVVGSEDRYGVSGDEAPWTLAMEVIVHQHVEKSGQQ